MAGLPEAPEPAGFGRCGECAYRFAGSVETCFECASRTFEHLPDDPCLTCEGALKDDGSCGNPLCNKPVDARGWRMIWAVSMRTGELKAAISAYKYDGCWGWAHIFGRVLIGHLCAQEEEIRRRYGVIVPMPTFVGPGGRSDDHIGDILRRAEVEDPSWPFRFDVLAKTVATRRLVETRTFRERAEIAEAEIGPAIDVLHADAVAGQNVLVFDDVFTGGLTLREVAHKLRAAGARSVDGIVLARQPFRG